MERIPNTKAEEMIVEKTIEMCRGSAHTDLAKAVQASLHCTTHKEEVSM